MPTPLSFPYSLLTVPFNHATDFLELADNCERFAEVLVECDDPALKLALCGRLSACLALLQPTLLEPVPETLKPFLTVDSLPAHFPEFDAEGDELCRYCQVLTQLLMSGSLAPHQQRVIGNLLASLVSFFADMVKMPRWIKTQQGVISLDAFH
ncbi:hypothetical protein [Enterobacter sp. Bisph1]|uniref:hypothetical protein n=1 Tax=Enterobacter sp. Bisph1 TaxID=1274399 RepID=UPI00057C02EA|nr:hypothetical protein [Enterobacter sp. Bisph1]